MNSSSVRGVRARGILLCLVFISVFPAIGKNAQNLQQLVLVQPSASSELQQKSVLQIHEDSAGYLWFVTQGALHRFDGQELLALPQSTQKDAGRLLGNNPVVAIAGDPDGMVWIATIGAGVIQFDPATGVFSTLEDLGVKEDQNSRYAYALASTTQRIYWLSKTGLYYWQKGAAQAQHYSLNETLGPITGIWSKHDKIWLSTATQLLWLDEQHQPNIVPAEQLSGTTSALTLTPSGTLLAFGSYGVRMRLPSVDAFEPYHKAHTFIEHKIKTVGAPPLFIDALMEPDGRLWVLTVSDGVLERDAEGNEFIHTRDRLDPSGFPDDNVMSLCRDRTGRLWFGTLAHGFVHRAEGYQWLRALREKYQEENPSSNNVFAILPDQQGGLWLGLENSGLRYTSANGMVTDHSKPLASLLQSQGSAYRSQHVNVRSLMADADALLVGLSRQLMRYWPQQQRAELLLNKWLSDAPVNRSAVRTIKRRKNGDLLVASEHAGLLIQQSNGDVLQYSSTASQQYKLSTSRVMDVHEDSFSNLWLATDAGVYRITSEGFVSLIREASENHFANSFWEDLDGNLWVGSFGGIAKLSELNAPVVRVNQFSLVDGLGDNVIYAIRQDGVGHLWASSNRGLMRLRANESRWESFRRDDGLSDDEYNLHAATQLSDGRLIFGGISGLSIIDPRQERKPNDSNGLVISALQTGFSELKPQWSHSLSSISLSAQESALMLKLATPGTANQVRQQFFYRFHDEKRWHSVGAKRELMFANLAPGMHHLELAWSYGGPPQYTARRMAIDVVPMWWQRNDLRWAVAAILLLIMLQRVYAWREHWHERMRQEKALRASDERLRLALWGTGDSLWDWDCLNGHVERTGFETLLGYRSDEIEPSIQWRDELMHPDDVATAQHQLMMHLNSEQPFYEAQYRLRNAKGAWIWVLDRGHIVERDANGNALRLAGTMRDISEQRRRDDELKHLANYDSLTQLPNRTLFLERLQQALLSAQRRDTRVAVLFIDLDQFKSINDSYGHHAGDELLCAVAARLRACVRIDDTVARLGGDEFTVILENLQILYFVSRVVDDIRAIFAEPFLSGEHALQISASIGISVYPDDADSSERLLTHADMAMYASKSQGRNTARFFEPRMNLAAQRRGAISIALRKAEEAGELQIHYQPRFDIDGVRVKGLEALLRWNSGTLGAVSPSEFIPVAEEYGVITSLGYWVLNEVMRQLKAWQGTALANLPVAVNVSIRQMFDASFQQNLEQLLKTYQVSASLVNIEITESLLMEDVTHAIKTLQALRDTGFSIYVDDFGTGYSSLSYLRRFPINGLKIDRSFIHNMMTDADDATIVDTIIAMAHALRLSVIAEGVETEAQLAFLRQKGCEELQGFLLAKPMAAEQCEQFIVQHRAHITTHG